MASHSYRIARQEHLGEMLDRLEGRGRLRWRWEYDTANGRAIFHVDQDGTSRALVTRDAEQVAQSECDALGIRWKPVPHPGGEDQRRKVLDWIAEGEA